MRLGMNFLLWTTHVQSEHHPLLAEMREAGYDGAEIPIGQGDAAYHRALGAELDRLGYARTAVTSLDAATNAASSDPKIRAAAVARLKWAIEMVHELGAEALVGPFHSAFKEFTGDPPTDDERKWSAEVLAAVVDDAQAAGIRLAIEALNRFECYLVNTQADSRAIVDAVGHPSLGMLYDTHHAHIEEKDPAAAVATGGEKIFHVHTSESDRGAPGSGQVRWRETFEALQHQGYDGWLVIEAFSRRDPGFASAINVWREFDRADDIWREGQRFLRAAWADPAGIR